YLEQGDLLRADDILRDALARARTEDHLLALVEALRLHALLETRQQSWQEAESTLEEALALARAKSYPYAEAKALYVYGQLDASRGEPEQARQHFEQALAICARLGERLYAEHIERALLELPRRAPGRRSSTPQRHPSTDGKRTGDVVDRG